MKNNFRGTLGGALSKGPYWCKGTLQVVEANEDNLPCRDQLFLGLVSFVPWSGLLNLVLDMVLFLLIAYKI